jgi:hypothetical protein
VKNPVKVVYRRFPAVDLPGDGLRFDRAYWVSGIKVRGSQTDVTNSGRVDAITHGLGGRLAKAKQETPQAVTGPVSPGVKFEQRQIPGAAIARGNLLDLTLTNVAGATFDLERMGLTLRKALTIRVDTNAATDLTLRGFYKKVSVVGGKLRKAPGGVTLSVSAGKHDLTVKPG